MLSALREGYPESRQDESRRWICILHPNLTTHIGQKWTFKNELQMMFSECWRVRNDPPQFIISYCSGRRHSSPQLPKRPALTSHLRQQYS
jgi:hypothetical protein